MTVKRQFQDQHALEQMQGYQATLGNQGDLVWKPDVNTSSDLPITGSVVGDTRMVKETGDVYRYTKSGWKKVASPVTSVNGHGGDVTVDEFTPSNTGAQGDILVKGSEGYQWVDKNAEYDFVTKTGTEISISNFNNVIDTTEDITVTIGTVKEGYRYLLKATNSGEEDVTLTFNSVDYTLDSGKTYNLEFIALNSTTLECLSSEEGTPIPVSI